MGQHPIAWRRGTDGNAHILPTRERTVLRDCVTARVPWVGPHQCWCPGEGPWSPRPRGPDPCVQPSSNNPSRSTGRHRTAPLQSGAPALHICLAPQSLFLGHDSMVLPAALAHTWELTCPFPHSPNPSHQRDLSGQLSKYVHSLGHFLCDRLNVSHLQVPCLLLWPRSLIFLLQPPPRLSLAPQRPRSLLKI